MKSNRFLYGIFTSLMVLSFLVGCAAPAPQIVEKEIVVTKEVQVEKIVTATPEAAKPVTTAKYIFLFIGDGMAVAQRNAAELYLAETKNSSERPEKTRLLMNTFPAQGMNTTYDLTSVIPDSASTATAIATGHKTASGVLGVDPEGKEVYKEITETAKEKGMKIGVITTVSLDHATPAAFYAHEKSRKNMYEISVQLANSGFDYFGGGQILVHTKEGQPDSLDIAKEKGYTITTNRAEFETLKPGVEKVIAMASNVDKDAAMQYTIDQKKDDLTLTDFVNKGIDLLDNPKGFFMMVEGGKIDWACHANDAAATIIDTLAFDESIEAAYKFYQKHPDETLIIVTGDHETGGMTIGYAGTQYASFVDKIRNQKVSYIGFDEKLAEYKANHTAANAKFEEILPTIQDAFGLYVIPEDKKAALVKAVEDGKAETATDEVKKAAKEATKELTQSLALTDLELGVLETAFKESMLGKEERSTNEQTYLLYGGYEPLTVKLTTILNQKSGIAWTSYSHTGIPVQTSAVGVGSEQFNGYYDQTDIYSKMMKSAGF